jgi:hypothetical protein
MKFSLLKMLFLLTLGFYSVKLLSQETPFTILGPVEISQFSDGGLFQDIRSIRSIGIDRQNRVFYWEANNFSLYTITGVYLDLYTLNNDNIPQLLTPYQFIYEYSYSQELALKFYIFNDSTGILTFNTGYIDTPVPLIKCYWTHYDRETLFTNSDSLILTQDAIIKFVRQISNNRYFILSHSNLSHSHTAYCVDNQMQMVWTREIQDSLFTDSVSGSTFRIDGLEVIDSTHFAIVVNDNHSFDDKVLIFNENPDIPPTQLSLSPTIQHWSSYKTFASDITGTFIIVFKNQQNQIQLSLCSLNGISYVTCLQEQESNIYLEDLVVAADSLGIVIAYKYGQSFKMVKYSLDGSILWTQVFNNSKLNNEYVSIRERLKITKYGNYVLGFYRNQRFVLAKIMSDGSHTVLNEDDTQQNSIAPKFICYPNPFSENIHIELQGKSDAPIQASIYNIKGQLVKNLLIDKNMIIWDGTDENNSVVSKGIYLIKLKQNNKTIVSKILKLK